MTTKILTVTSKNQVTLPADIVRQFAIARNRQFELKVEGNSLRLTPKPSLEATMQKYAQRHSAKKPLAAEDMQPVTASIIAKRAAE